ncbi:hypothetical protein HZU77_006895 [Neisseriaceae bacterium TC5R-5]|nr:hypothetical protein [Neisseriaceae bacterium TC5R-5]
MTEPTTSSLSIAASTGLLALLIAWLGQVGAEVVMVGLASLAGCLLSLSGLTTLTLRFAITRIVVHVITALVLSWGLVGIVVGQVPALEGPYAPAMVAFLIGLGGDRFLSRLTRLLPGGEQK